MRDQSIAVKDISSRLSEPVKISSQKETLYNEIETTEDISTAIPNAISTAMIIKAGKSESSNESEDFEMPSERLFDYSTYFRNHPLFATATESFINQLCSLIHLRYQQPGDIIIQEGELGRAMFFVVKGVVTVCSADGERFFAELEVGKFFGEIGVFFKCPRTANVIAKTRCMLLVVTSTDLDSILQQHTDVADDIMSEAIYRYVSLIKSRKFPTLAELVTKEKSELNDFLQRICCRTPKFYQLDFDVHDLLKEKEREILINYEIGEEIMTDDSFSQFFYIVASGSVDVYLKGQVVNSLKHRSFFGEIIMLKDVTSICKYVAGTSCQVYALNQEQLLDLLRHNEVLCRMIGKALRQTFALFEAHLRINVLSQFEPQSSVQESHKDIPVLDEFRPLLYEFDGSTLELTNLVEPQSSLSGLGTPTNQRSIGSAGSSPNTRHMEFSTGYQMSTLPNPSDHESLRVRRPSALSSYTAIPVLSTNLPVPSLEYSEKDEDGEENETIEPKISWEFSNIEKKIVNSTIASLGSSEPKRRRASIAVWTDSKLANIAQQKQLAAGRIKSDGQKSVVQATHLRQVGDVSDNVSDTALSTESELYEVTNSPFELKKVVATVLQYLSFKDAWRARAISHVWSQTFSNVTDLLREIDLSVCHKSITDEVIETIGRYCGRNIEIIILRNCWRITNNGIKEFAHNARNLRVADLCGCWEITDDGLHSLSLSCRKLQSLDLSNCRKVSDIGLHHLMSNCEDLRDLFLSYCKALSDTFFAYVSTKLVKVRRLNLQRCIGITDAGYLLWSTTKLILPKLQEMNISDCSFLTDQAVSSLGVVCPNLKVINLSFCCALTPEGVYSLIGNCRKLRAIDASFCGNAITDDVLLFMAQNVQDLERLSIRGCVQVTDIGIDNLQNKAQNLRILNATNCKGISKDRLATVPETWSLADAQTPVIEMINIAGSDVYNSGHIRRYTSP